MSDTIDTVTVDEYPDMRARIVYDEYAECPYDDGSSPIIALPYREHPRQVTAITSYEVSPRIIEAASRWLRYEPGPDRFERYMRAFHGTTELVWFNDDRTDYVTFDTAAWREAMGITDEWRSLNPAAKLANADEYRAWLDGESYVIIVERRLWKATVDRDLIPDPDSVDDEWEFVDSLAGLYGDLHGYVTKRAQEMIRDNA